MTSPEERAKAKSRIEKLLDVEHVDFDFAIPDDKIRPLPGAEDTEDE